MANYKATGAEKEVLEKYMLQFLNIEKQYPLLPGSDNPEAVAALMGIEVAELERLRNRFRKNAREAAVELLEDPEVVEWIEALPFEDGDTIVALGDSITDDLQGWFSIFEQVLNIGLDQADYTFINSGNSYDTSTDALKRLNRDVLDHNPDWVIIAVGTFDAQRLYVSPDRVLVSLADYWENINTIESAINEVTENPAIWITPPPVISELLQQIKLFNFDLFEKDLSSIREILTGKKGYIIDPLGERMNDEEEKENEGEPNINPAAWNYLSDGLHPSLSGHVHTVKEVIRYLALADEVQEGASFETPGDYDQEG